MLMYDVHIGDLRANQLITCVTHPVSGRPYRINIHVHGLSLLDRPSRTNLNIRIAGDVNDVVQLGQGLRFSFPSYAELQFIIGHLRWRGRLNSVYRRNERPEYDVYMAGEIAYRLSNGDGPWAWRGNSYYPALSF